MDYFSTSHPHSNSSNSSNQYAFTVTTPSSLTHSESSPTSVLHSPGSILASTAFPSALSTSFNFSSSNHPHSLYQIDEKKSSNHLHHHHQNHHHHPYPPPPSSMLSPLSTHLGLGSPASTRAPSSDIEDDIQRKRANRLSLTSSIASSAPSTTASEIDGSEEGNDFDMGDGGQYWNFCDSNDQNLNRRQQQQQQQQSQQGGSQAQQQQNLGGGGGGNGIMEGNDTEMNSLGRSRGSTLSDAFRFQNADRVPDLVHSRSNATIQARYQSGDRSPLLSSSECNSSHSNVAEFVFSDFIADAEPEGLVAGVGVDESQGIDDQDLQKTVDSAQALSLYSSPVHSQPDSFATPQRPLRHRDVSHLSAGDPSSSSSSLLSSSYSSLQFSSIHQQSHAFNSCPTSPASPMTNLPSTSLETPQYNHLNHSFGGGVATAASTYAALHRPQFGNGGRSFSFNVIPAHQDQPTMSGVIHDPHGLFSSDRGVCASGGGEGAISNGNGANRASEGESHFASAGLGLFGYPQTRPDSLGRSHSLPGPMFISNEPLSCNPAHITPSASSRSAGYGTDRDHSAVSSPAGSLNVSSMVLFDSDGAESPGSHYNGRSRQSSPSNFFNESDGEDDDDDDDYDGEYGMEDRQNTIKSPPSKKQVLKGGGGGDYLFSSPSKSSNVRISAKRLFSSTNDDGDEDGTISILSSSAPSAPNMISSNAASSLNATHGSSRRTPSTSRSARGTRRSNGLTINSSASASRSRSPASLHNGSPSNSSIYGYSSSHSAHASPYLSPSTIQHGNKIRSASSSNLLPRSPLAGQPASPAESVISAFSSRSYHSGQEDGNSLNGTPSSSLGSASINAEGVITKRSRGRRVPDDPSELNNLGKMGKIYTCQVEGCGKCFKRSEHLKRHVRSIHTDEKPFECPYPTCHKKFSRLDNLNQHSRVHQVTTSGASSTGSISARSSQAGSVSPAFSPRTSIPSSGSGNSIASSVSSGRRGSAPSSISIRMVGSAASSASENGTGSGSGAQIKRKRGSASLNRDKSNQQQQQQRQVKMEEEEGMFALDEEQEDSNADVKPLNLRR